MRTLLFFKINTIFILLNVILLLIFTSNSSSMQIIKSNDNSSILVVDDFNDFRLYRNDDYIFSINQQGYLQFQFMGTNNELGDSIEIYELSSNYYFSSFNLSLKINLHSLTDYWGKLELHLKQIVISEGKRLVDRTICSCQIGDLSEDNLGYYLANCRFNSTYYCSSKIEEQLSSEEVVSFFLSQSDTRIQSIILANSYLVISESWDVEEIKSVNCIQISVITGSTECNFNTFVYDVSGFFSTNVSPTNPSISESALANPGFSFISIFVLLFLVGYYKLHSRRLKSKK